MKKEIVAISLIVCGMLMVRTGTRICLKDIHNEYLDLETQDI